jgi:DNA-directed RNA polymerase specialized sigma24 family protein
MEIVQQYSANDRQDLFKDWHHQYYKMIRKVVIETTMDESLVDDIFQNSSIVIYEKLVRNELHLTSKLSTFLYSVAYKMCMEQIRKKKKIKIVSFEDDFENREDKVYDADKEAMYKQLDLCVEKLPENLFIIF